jgi:hypothetical protein
MYNESKKNYKNICKNKVQIGKKNQNIKNENIFPGRTLRRDYRALNAV